MITDEFGLGEAFGEGKGEDFLLRKLWASISISPHKNAAFSHALLPSARKALQQINLLHLLCQVADKKVDIVLRNSQVTMPQHAGQGYDVSTAQIHCLAKVCR